MIRGWVRAGWALACLVLAFWLALVEVFWLPLRIGGVFVPLSIVAAVVGNLLLVRLAHRTTGSGKLAVLPAVAWLVVVVASLIRRPEGDLVLAGTGALGLVSLAFLMCGVVAAAFAVGTALAGGRPPRRVSPATSEPAASRAGSGTGGAR
jgi:hypothetical protein